MRFISTLLLTITLLTGCNSSSAESSQGASDSIPSDSSEEDIKFSLNGLTVRVEHTNMEISDECPRVKLANAQGSIIDQQPLCQVDVEGYRSFDAREDFAFISFEEYRVEDHFLVYDVDLALKQGSAFVAECRAEIENQRIRQPECQKRGP